LTSLVGTVTGATGGVTGLLGGGLPIARDLENLPAPLLKRMEDLAIDIRAELEISSSIEERQLPSLPLSRETPLGKILSSDQLDTLTKDNPGQAVSAVPLTN
jgi:hypothetical protein